MDDADSRGRAGEPPTSRSRPRRSLGRERDPFKLDVRKLKNLGLTQSFDVGYAISPRGEAYLAATHRTLPAPPRVPGGPESEG